jgi:DNA-binding GntR family transcriptional regulator
VPNAVDRAYEKIRGGILDGVLAPGSRLKEKALVEYCGVSRTPVRDALRRLAAEDFVSIQPNQGAHVRYWDKEDLDDFFALRALL